MTHLTDLPRVFAALACSGVFWLTAVLILQGRVAAAKATAAAVALMILSVFLFMQTILH